MDDTSEQALGFVSPLVFHISIESNRWFEYVFPHHQRCAAGGIVSKLRIVKHSPFLLKPETLDQLAFAACDEPAVLDLVGGYKAAQENLEFYADQVVAELEHYGVSAT